MATLVAGATPVHPGLVTFCDATAQHCFQRDCRQLHADGNGSEYRQSYAGHMAFNE